MIALGLDPSLTGFGWCVHDSTKLGEARVVKLGVIPTLAKTLFLSRYAYFRAQVLRVIEAHPQIQCVGVESPPYGEQFSEGLYALFVYVNEALYLARRDVVYFDPSTVKMLAKMDPSVRRGTMDKSDMVEAAKAETGIKRWNHNAADAYIIARQAARFWELESGVITDEDLTPAERQSYHRVHTFSRGRKAGQTEHRGLIFREDDRFFRFSQVPPNEEEEELRRWLCRNKETGPATTPGKRRRA